MVDDDDNTPSCCAVCGRTGVKLSRCSRCKSDHYLVCGKKCQAKDWKDHKDDDCYVYDAILAEAVKRGDLLLQQKEKSCTICLDEFCELDFLRRQVEEMLCGHVSHKGCHAEMHRSHKEQLKSDGDPEKLFKCPLCLQYVGQSIRDEKNKPWFQQDAIELIRIALRSVYQLQLETNLRGTEENEIVFVNSIIREAEEEANLREDALESTNKAKEEFEKMLPTLRATESLQERENLTMKINVLITSAVTSYLIPRYKSQDEFKEKAEKQYPLIQRWLLTCQLLGPYVWD
jgi:hypothetical protein